MNIKIQISCWKKHGISNKEEVKICKSHFDKELGFAYSLFSSVYFPLYSILRIFSAILLHINLIIKFFSFFITHVWKLIQSNKGGCYSWDMISRLKISLEK